MEKCSLVEISLRFRVGGSENQNMVGVVLDKNGKFEMIGNVNSLNTADFEKIGGKIIEIYNCAFHGKCLTSFPIQL